MTKTILLIFLILFSGKILTRECSPTAILLTKNKYHQRLYHMELCTTSLKKDHMILKMNFRETKKKLISKEKIVFLKQKLDNIFTLSKKAKIEKKCQTNIEFTLFNNNGKSRQSFFCLRTKNHIFERFNDLFDIFWNDTVQKVRGTI